MSGATKIRVDVQGNVGLGTATPLQKLHVAGDVTMGNVGTAYKINAIDTLSATALGNSVITSSLQTVGNLSTLNVVKMGCLLS